ncbi:MAG: hypothetical protein RLZZ619_574 [Pseudomonadota bacterium]
MFLAFLIIIPLITFIFYIRAISRTLAAISEPYRTQSPGMAWLLLIPIFNVIWFFFLLRAIKDGFAQMYRDGLTPKEIDSGYNYGIGMGCCWAASFIPQFIFIALIPMFVFSILHWNKLNSARRAISKQQNYSN